MSRLYQTIFRVIEEPAARQQAARRLTPGRVVRLTYCWQEIGAPISAGRQDEIAVRRRGRSPDDYLYVAYRNTQLDYVGLEAFQLSELVRYPGCKYSEAACRPEAIFLSATEQLEDALGARWGSISMSTLIRWLVDRYDELCC